MLGDEERARLDAVQDQPGEEDGGDGGEGDAECHQRHQVPADRRVVGRLHFTGHFTGSFNGIQGKGQKVDFIATDIYRIPNGRIAENWHLEDNLTLLQQLGVVNP